ncbi:MAG: 5'/3'-nucleotidase SurE [Alloprevotella sp.]|nr:5'/3'-nucleotidase SurE [Alloprevotella sp.]
MQDKQRPYLVISNDDGVRAKGLQTLIDVLRPHYDLLVVAPDGSRSAMSMAITARQPIIGKLLRQEEGLEEYVCSGTPVDCLKLALCRYARRKPDLVIGGINHGDNSSVNAHYSGTVGIAAEGALQGLPAIAFSLCDMEEDADFEPLRPFILQFVDKVLREGMPAWTCLNINFPEGLKTYKGVRYCRMAQSRWVKEVEDCPHPWKPGLHFWLVGECEELEPEATDTDRWALANGYVAVTPQTFDTTSYDYLQALKQE